ncbi:uncharacterized protein LOC105189684 [Harpegnathos saltator]|uniref:uncharacterized protein LOC105189684 n=1 Tax=Harpegnathos saltator TaxID=610380 RepID=UPI00058D8869|nr:uncharacterized protein LOC105189684 [Harpegnathos saltator]
MSESDVMDVSEHFITPFSFEKNLEEIRISVSNLTVLYEALRIMCVDENYSMDKLGTKTWCRVSYKTLDALYQIHDDLILDNILPIVSTSLTLVMHEDYFRYTTCVISKLRDELKMFNDSSFCESKHDLLVKCVDNTLSYFDVLIDFINNKILSSITT